MLYNPSAVGCECLRHPGRSNSEGMVAGVGSYVEVLRSLKPRSFATFARMLARGRMGEIKKALAQRIGATPSAMGAGAPAYAWNANAPLVRVGLRAEISAKLQEVECDPSS